MTERASEFDLPRALFDHAHHVSERIRATVLAAANVVGISTGIMGVVVVAARADVALFLAPLVALGVLTYVVHLFTEASLMGGYQQHLEVRLADSAGEPVVSWESGIVPMRYADRGTHLNNRFWGAIVLSGLVAAITRLWLNDDFALAGIQAVLGGMGVYAWVVSLREWNSAFERGYDRAKRHFEEDQERRRAVPPEGS